MDRGTASGTARYSYKDCQLNLSIETSSLISPSAVDDAVDSGVETYSSVQEVVETGEVVCEAVDWEDSELFGVPPPVDDAERLVYCKLLGTDELREDDWFSVPIGGTDEVALTPVKGALEDDLLALPDVLVLEEKGVDPPPYGPLEVEDETGEEDEVIPPTRLERLDALPVPVGPYVEVEFSRVYGPAEELLAPPLRLEELGRLIVPVGSMVDVELDDVAYGGEEDATDEPIPPEAIVDETYPELKGPTVD